MAQRSTDVDLWDRPDAVLVGGGIMSATVAVLLRQLEPGWTLQVIEALPQVALESSHAWHNAGTGHAGLCELNYTPRRSDGGIDIGRAVAIQERFEMSRHGWASWVHRGILTDPRQFIRSVPHLSFVRGTENQRFLRDRHAALTRCGLFAEMEFTTDPSVIETWAPLLMEGRRRDEPVAATRVRGGTDIDYGALTRQLTSYLEKDDRTKVARQCPVTDLTRLPDGHWRVSLRTGQRVETPFVFVGAGGASLPLLQRAGIPEIRGYGGFPVSGQFLLCRDEAVTGRHHAKVYGQAPTGAPPMSAPHLDSRFIGGRRLLLFGPFAGFSPKFLRSGSCWDLLRSVRWGNVPTMIGAGWDNLGLTAYLIGDCLARHRQRCDRLRQFFPAAEDGHWQRLIGGQRVQILKPDPRRWGRLEFGTEVVATADGSLASVLGASPGASVSVAIALEVLQRCFPAEMASQTWRDRLTDRVPAWGMSLARDPERARALRAEADRWLELDGSPAA